MRNEVVVGGLSDDLTFDDDSRNRLRHSLSRTASGSDADLTTPLLNEGETRVAALETLEDFIGMSQNPDLRHFDDEERDKVGPYSIMVPWEERVESVLIYWEQDDISEVDLNLFIDTSRELASHLKRSVLQQLPLAEAAKRLPKNTLLGLPTMSIEDSFVQLYLSRARRILSGEGEVLPAVIGWRGTASGEGKLPKQRVVWMMDHAETILGLALLHPMLDLLRLSPWFCAWKHPDDVSRYMREILLQGKEVFSLDFSSFDSSAHHQLISTAFEAFSSWFGDADQLIRTLEHAFLTVGIVVPPSTVWTGRYGGVPSGSALTNIVDTWINLVAAFSVAKKLGTRVSEIAVLGDDAVVLFDPSPPRAEVEDAYADFGLTVSKEKQWISSTSIHFLQNLHSLDLSDGRGVRTPFRTVNGMLSYERYRSGWSKYMDSARWIMQSESSKFDLRFTQFVEWWSARDNVLSSGVSVDEIFQRAGGLSEVNRITGRLGVPGREIDEVGLQSFRTVAILRDLF